MPSAPNVVALPCDNHLGMDHRRAPAGRIFLLRQRSLAGVSALALSIAALSAIDAGSGSARASEMYLNGTTTISNEAYSGQTTTGGTGSGGGAGLGGAIYVGNGATVNINNVDFLGNTVVGGTGGVGSTGGTLNGVNAGTAGTNGTNGADAKAGAAYLNDGNGTNGQNGFTGGAGTTGAGGRGGAGGDGSDGSATTADIAKTIVDQAKATFDALGNSTTAGFYTAVATELATAAAAASSGGGVVTAANPALAGALTAMAATFTSLAAEATAESTGELTQAAYETAYLLAIQVTSYELGAAGAGGAGGIGGTGGAGAFGQGGGAGGNGGDGGDATSVATSAAGGNGGEGGLGGAGGFGAGGGLGGTGGAGGADGDNAVHGDHDGDGGKGGAGGFGAGVGSTGNGTSNGTGGGGGSGYGGAIFVASGGTLNISGNATFDGNSVFGGSSENGGQAGEAAGTDLFMMKGSTVNLNAGAGNTIVFNGTIADNSAASISSTSIASGQGAGLNIQSGLVILNGANTYTGQTKISGGVLQAIDGGGVNSNSNINLAGGIFQSNGTFNRYLGAASNRLQWTGSGGFAAEGGDLTVNLNNGATLTWDSGNFVGAGSSLLFGSDSANADVHFKNAINLNGGERTIVNNGGADGDNLVYMKGVLSNGSLVLGDGTTQGTIVLSAANTYSGTTTVKAGTTLALQGNGTIASSSKTTIDGDFDMSALSGGTSLVTMDGSGNVLLGANTLTLTNGSTTFAGVVSGTGGITVSGGTQTLSGTNTYTGKTQINAGATAALSGNGSIATSSEVVANGHFDISATDEGASLITLSGVGTVALGSRTLTITEGSTTFAGAIGGTGGVTVSGGTQTLSGTNTYTGKTKIDAGATAALTGWGSIAASSGLQADGIFDISETGDGASLVTLSGVGTVALGTKTLTVSNGSTTFAGAINGSGGVKVSGGTQTLSGANGYTGQTQIDDGATLALEGSGTVASSSGVEANGHFDISETDDGASLVTLSGVGAVLLGSKTLTVTNGSTTFAGGIEGAGGVTVAGGTQTLSGSNSYSGKTTVASGSALALEGTGSIAESSELALAGTFDISETDNGSSIRTLSGLGAIVLGDQSLAITHGSTTFSGSVDGTGYLTVSGGEQTFQAATINTGLQAASGGKILVHGGSIDAGASKPAVSVVNGGGIEIEQASLNSGVATAYASFDEAGKTANIKLGAGTTIVANNGVLLQVDRSGVGSDGIVNFTIATNGVANGDILDGDARTGAGTTTVALNTGSSWQGRADTGSFTVGTGASAVFETGSTIDGNLLLESGSSIAGPLEVTGNASVQGGAITGNSYIHGNLDLNGLISPGASPGVIDIGGNLNADSFAASKFEVVFGSLAPQAGVDYDQVNVAGDLTGTLPVTLAGYGVSRSAALGKIEDIELLRVGGNVEGEVVQANRYTQNGHEVVLDTRTRLASAEALVSGTGATETDWLTEEDFFVADSMTVYGIRSFIQDETYGVAALAGTIDQANRDILGTYIDRLQADENANGSPIWGRFGVNRTEVNETVSSTQTLTFGQFGTDFVRFGNVRAGVIGSYGNSSSDVTTETGIGKLDGSLYSAGLHVNWTSGDAYVDAIGQYGWSDWTFSPTAASKLTVDANTATAALEAGYGVNVDKIRFTPWAQLVYQTTSFGDVESAWVDSVTFNDGNSLMVRGGLRTEGRYEWLQPYLDVAVAYDALGDKTVTVDNFAFNTGWGGTQAEMRAGLQADILEGLTLSTNFKGAYGLSGDLTSYQGTVGLVGRW
ncbi:fibronectin-binding autotransporter adhesin [Kaistia defluvii]|uniref:Fibronectin-binding autotransporter adhesin n=2 Tax=Kaistia defluvii TaxID=410841 RepID=A0ABV2QZE2_9HYPH